MKLIKQNVPLAPLTTIGLGGPATNFVACDTADQIVEALAYAKDRGLRTHVLAGGSNTIFSDQGYDGLVIAIHLKGVRVTGGRLTVQAGEPWDAVVEQSVAMNAAGLEALSGIPGLTGATPMQNVGAYGQEVADTIRLVTAIDRTTLQTVTFSNEECRFSYRTSRFKEEDKDRYVITEVQFDLRPGGEPTVRYEQLQQELGSGQPTLQAVRAAVLKLRRSKSMVIDPADPHSRSCGSFFMNPIVSKEQLHTLQKKYPEMPFFEWKGKDVKVPAAFLIEAAGFTKGMRRGNVGISPNHVLALVNYGGSTEELLALAASVQAKVREAFGIELTREPVVIE